LINQKSYFSNKKVLLVSKKKLVNAISFEYGGGVGI
tara:strand:+ start:130 stop:237 length:108 start_codon:yes stop_codon:yes gene_type:complete